MERNKEKISIDLLDDSLLIKVLDNRTHLTTSKTVKIQTLIKAFQDQDGGISTPVLPRNTIKYVEKGNKATLFLYGEPTHFKATVGDKIYENCSRPGLVMIIYLNCEPTGWSMCDSKAFAVKEDRLLLNDHVKLYGLPFPNVSDTGWICWGNNASGGVFASLTGLGMLIDRLFNSPFNNHVFHSGSFRHLGIENHHDFFKYIQDKPFFPEELLLNSVGSPVLGDF